MWNYRPIAAVTVPYITVNVYNYPGPVIVVTNNLAGFVLFKIGYRDLGICFSNKLSP